MAALTKDRVLRTKGVGRRPGYRKVAAAVIIFAGAAIAVNAAGFVVPASDTAALKVIGVSEAYVNNSAGAAGDKEVPFVTGLDVEFNNAGGAIVQASEDKLCYVADDNSVTTSAVAANDIVMGRVTEFSTTKVWVYVDEDQAA
jgi:hypothetical protein